MPSLEKFREALEKFQVEEKVIAQINEGFDSISNSAPKKTRAIYFKRALDILEEKVEASTLQEMLETNACCKTGFRQKKSKEFAKINSGLSLEEKLAKIAKAPYMNMGRPELIEENGLIIHAVTYFVDGKYACPCPNISKVSLEEPISKKYCYCCAGHFKYHYEIMLGVKLRTIEIVSSPLDNNGENPCVIKYEVCSLSS